jgi:tetratricopeptide (TPR) repeat protein
MPVGIFMRRSSRRNHLQDKRLGRFHICCVGTFLLAALPVGAQTEDETGRIVYPTDAYGNVQPVETTWRSVGSFRNPVEREALTGYQTSTRRYGQRSGNEPFALPNDVWAVSRLSAMGTQDRPSVKSALSTAKRRAFEKYGGFARRRQTDEQGQPEDVLTRKSGLLNAYSLNAPVYRALTRPKGMVDLKSSVGRTPFLGSDLPDDTVSPTLEQQLDRTSEAEYQRVRQEAWALYRDGDYRQAIRTFETALTLSPEDLEARIGEIFAYLTLGARRTAAALFTELLARDENPFRHELRMRERFGNVADPNTLQLQAGLLSRDDVQNVDASALYTFALWYLGQKDDAVRAAEALARRAPNRPYALWPVKMNAVRGASPPTSP